MGLMDFFRGAAGGFKSLGSHVMRGGRKLMAAVQNELSKPAPIPEANSPQSPGGYRYTDDERTSIDASKQAYLPPQTRSTTLGDYMLVPDENDDRYVTYQNPKTKKLLIAYRGTATADDVDPDAAILVGTHGKHARFREALEYHDRMLNRFQGYASHVTGHSLGGALAHHVAHHRDATSGTGFNAGAGFGTSYAGQFKNFVI